MSFHVDARLSSGIWEMTSSQIRWMKIEKLEIFYLLPIFYSSPVKGWSSNRNSGLTNFSLMIKNTHLYCYNRIGQPMIKIRSFKYNSFVSNCYFIFCIKSCFIQLLNLCLSINCSQSCISFIYKNVKALWEYLVFFFKKE